MNKAEARQWRKLKDAFQIDMTTKRVVLVDKLLVGSWLSTTRHNIQVRYVRMVVDNYARHIGSLPTHIIREGDLIVIARSKLSRATWLIIK